MRILQISSAENFGGGEKHLVDLCRKLTEKNYDVLLATRPQSNWLERLSFIPPENISYLPLRNAVDIFSARNLAAIIRQKNIEVVHAHLARDYATAALAARITKTKLILTRHLLFPLNSFYKYFLPKNTVFIAVSEGVRRKLLAQNIVAPKQIQLVYNGIDAQHFQTASETTDKRDLRRQLNLPPAGQIVGIAGEITAHKGQADFVRAAADILKSFPATEFLIVGQDASPQKLHQKQLETLIKNSGLQNKIHFSGWLADVAPVYPILDVFVSASRVEPFGLVIAEAMASGCATVATATDGAREIVTGETGIIVPVKNPAAIAVAVSKFLGDKNMRREFGRKAQTRIESFFDLKRMLTEVEEIYKSLPEA